LSAWAFLNMDNDQQSIIEWVKQNKSVIITTEILFLAAFGFMAFVRAGNPEIFGTEKPMELMMINGIMNSPEFPPRDLWLSGYSISYYYFGYVMTSMIAMLTGVPATMAFNLMLALIFGLAAVGSYGIVYNLLALSPLRRERAEGEGGNSPSTSLPLLGPLFLLFISNLEGFLEVLHSRGLFWKDGNNFWTWLDILELRDPPSQILAWTPQRGGWWWWRASRVIMDYDLKGNWTLDVINEFPAFSFVLGDLHPHVLAMPFVLLAVAIALNIYLGGWRGTINLYFNELHISKTGFVIAALMLGGLAFLNTWDILIGGALIVFSYALARVRESGWGWERIEDILLLGIPVLIAAYLMYLPFFIGFDSQAGGLVPNFMFPTRGAQLWVMWGTLFAPLLIYVFYLVGNRMPANWRAGVWMALGLVTALLAIMFTLGLLGLKLRPEIIQPILASQGLDFGGFISQSMSRRLTYIGSLITLLALLIPALSFLFADRRPQTEDDEMQDTESAWSTVNGRSSAVFVILLIVLGLLLILGPEFIYLRDNFGYRINTIFKFYYQAWLVLSLASATGIAMLLRSLRGGGNIAFNLVFVIILITGLAYPVMAFPYKTNNFKPSFGLTLDDFDYVQRNNPDEAAALQWLKSAPDGVVAEAVGGAYSSFARISIYTGKPTVLGWGNHEGQWRDGALQGSRQSDIETLYSVPDWTTTQQIIARYNIRYIYVGGLERSTYRVNEEKFNKFLKPVFQQGNVAIYEVP